MSNCPDRLQFTLSSHGDSVLRKMNVLREEHRFCDIQLNLGNANDSAIYPVHFHGHRVVLAASSDFLRDQFLLHEGQTELSVHVISSAKVVKPLLLSCYTGLLEVPVEELVSYLTAASSLQMSQVVEKCIEALTQYLHPDPACLKLHKCSKDKELRQLSRNWPISSSGENAVQLSTSVYESNTKIDRAVLSQPELIDNHEEEVVDQGVKEMEENRNVGEAETELFKDEALKFHISCSKESFDINSFNSNNPLFHAHTGASFTWKLHPAAVFKNLISSDIRSSPACKEWMEISQKQHEQGGGQVEKGNVYTRAPQPEGGESNLGSRSGTQLVNINLRAEDSDRVVQRPYLCRRCDKIFQHLQSYMSHLKEHRQFPCLVCGESFSQRSKLSHHVHVHTSVKPFRCPLCHEKFTQKSLLQEHLHLHTGYWPHMFSHQLTHKPS